MTRPVELVVASLDRLPGYRAALARGWSPDNVRGAALIPELLAAVDADPAGFVARQEDPDARNGPVPLPDGTFAERLPGVTRWIWDGAFCGSLGFRWRPGTAALPPHVLGHIGFAVVPWKRGHGHAAAAVRAILPFARALGLPHVEITADAANLASRRTIERAGGALVERFTKLPAYGGGAAVRYRIGVGA